MQWRVFGDYIIHYLCAPTLLQATCPHDTDDCIRSFRTSSLLSHCVSNCRGALTCNRGSCRKPHSAVASGTYRICTMPNIASRGCTPWAPSRPLPHMSHAKTLQRSHERSHWCRPSARAHETAAVRAASREAQAAGQSVAEQPAGYCLQHPRMELEQAVEADEAFRGR